MKKLVVDKDICIKCGACYAIDDEHFDMDGHGFSSVINNENIESENVKNAIDSCPVGAIKYSNCENENCECDDCKCEHCGDDCECGCK